MVDLYLTHEGDISISTNGDLNVAVGTLEAMQTIAIAMKTELGSFSARPQIGNTLSSLVGDLLTANNLKKAETLIYEALSGYTSFIGKSIEVRCVPVNKTQAIFSILVSNGAASSIYSIPFDYQYGVLEQRTSTAITDPVTGKSKDVPAIGVNPTEDI